MASAVLANPRVAPAVSVGQHEGTSRPNTVLTSTNTVYCYDQELRVVEKKLCLACTPDDTAHTT
jgi:hypothetical protein